MLSCNGKIVLLWPSTMLEVLCIVLVCNIMTFMTSHYDNVFSVSGAFNATFKGYFTLRTKRVMVMVINLASSS